MSDFTQAPEMMTQTYSWQTNILTSYNGTEQRFALAQEPRQSLALRYLADNDPDIQFWKYQFTFNASSLLNYIPLWGEATQLTAPVLSGATTFDSDFSKTDTALGQAMLLMHPDETTVEKVLCNTATRTDSQMQLSSGVIQNDYPIGSYCIPIQAMHLRTTPSYVEGVAATAVVNITADLHLSFELEGYGSVPINTYLGRPLLDKQPKYTGANEAFSQKITRLDYGARIQLQSGESTGHSVLEKVFISRGPGDRQWWKLFMSTIRGRQGSFYAPTYRHDATLASQPAQGGTSLLVDDSSQFTNRWENLLGHQDVAIFTADGDMQLRHIDGASTIDNGDGTQTIGLTAPLTNTPLGSTVEKVSFLELVRLSSDDVAITHTATEQQVKLTTRTISL